MEWDIFNNLEVEAPLEKSQKHRTSEGKLAFSTFLDSGTSDPPWGKFLWAKKASNRSGE